MTATLLDRETVTLAPKAAQLLDRKVVSLKPKTAVLLDSKRLRLEPLAVPPPPEPTPPPPVPPIENKTLLWVGLAVAGIIAVVFFMRS